MEKLEFGLILAAVGAGTTFAVLFLLSLVCFLLHKIFPYKEEDKKQC